MSKGTEVAVQYKLPENWNNETAYSFDHLSELVEQVHNSAYSSAVKAINRFATIRNYIIGYYIVEYEQNGSDRAKYGDKLLKRLAERVNKRGINETLLQNCRRFYSSYPQIREFLEGKSATALHQSAISATVSHKSEIFPATSGESISATVLPKSEKSPTVSDKFVTPAEDIISRLSFAHIRQLMTVEDPLARFFYETECIKCCWSIRGIMRRRCLNKE